MAKVNLSGLPRPARPAQTRTFTDPEQPGVEVTLTLRKIDPAEMASAMDAKEVLHSKFAETGFPLLNGEVVPLAEGLCQSLCMLELMQCGPEADRYTAEELIPLVVNLPTAGMEVLRWAGELAQSTAEKPAKN